ncbi:MAG: restriction endonuclease [Candidatus Omnitrophica bacterium]|nr:restriction endonuclease [Candidatus Omnitrophota bacterium]
MSKISNAKGRDPETGPSGYERLFGNAQLGQLLSKCQATVISTGNELERILENSITETKGLAIGNINKEKRVFKGAKKDANGKLHDVGIDVVIEKNSKIKLIELKDGDVFDVKKVAGEVESLLMVKSFLIKEGKFKTEDIEIYFCSFNQENKEYIYSGAKGLLPKGSAMTGKELCSDLGIDYDRIIRYRKQEQPENLDFFIKELIKIPEVKERLKDLLR